MKKNYKYFIKELSGIFYYGLIIFALNFGHLKELGFVDPIRKFPVDVLIWLFVISANLLFIRYFILKLINIKKSFNFYKDFVLVASPNLPCEKKCPNCCKDIPYEAGLCFHCKSDLTWRRHLQFSQTTLALLVAVIAVIGSFGPQLISIFVVNRAKISFTPINTDPESLTALVANQGNTVGFLVEVYILLEKEKNHDRYDYNVPPELQGINPNEIKKIRLLARNKVNSSDKLENESSYLISSMNYSCEIVYVFSDVSGMRYKRFNDSKCTGLFFLVANSEYEKNKSKDVLGK